jgi:Tfp pilus assembly protein PilN
MLTVIEIGPGRLSAVQGQANGKGPEILRLGSAELTAVDAASVKAALEKTGVRGTRAVLVVPRGQAVLRDLELPAGTPEELASMVRFQVEREVPLPIEEIRYSFVEAGRAAGKVRVQVAAARRELIDPAVAALESAGVKVAGAVVSSYGLLALEPETSSLSALVEVSAGEAEILVAQGGRMEMSRTAALPEGAVGDALAEEIEQTLRAWSAKAPGREVGRILLAGEGPQAEALAREVGGRLSRTVAVSGPGDLETSTAAGVCLGLLRGAAIPDLLNPPSSKRRFTPTKAHRIGALAAVVALMLVVWSQAALAEKRGELARKRAELARLEPQAADVLKTRRQAALAQQWYRDRNVWLGTLQAVRQAMDAQNLWFTGASFEHDGTVRLQGKARDDRHVTALVTALEKSGQFAKLKAPDIKQNTDKGDYRRDFVLTGFLAGAEDKVKK